MRTMALIALIFWVGFPGVALADISNPATEFSITQGNPNGLWSYADMNVGFTNFQLLSNPVVHPNGPTWSAGSGMNEIWVNDTGSNVLGVPADWLSLHPGPDTSPSVLRWTAPASIVGQANIQGQFLPGDSGIMDVGVRFDNTWLWQGIDSGAFDLSCSPSAGEDIDFVVYGGYVSGNTPLDVTITYATNVPEPATMSLLGIGALGIVGYIRRQRRK